MTTRGEVVWEWRSWDHLDPAAYPVTPQDRRAEWTHGNTVAETADGDIVVSFRNISTVVMIERATGKIVWTLGSPPLAQAARSAPAAQRQSPDLRQRHPPTGSPGDVLARDRGRSAHERDRVGVHRPVALRVLQPLHLGSAAARERQHARLRRCHGRIFEVTRDREVVWEYVSPHFAYEPGAPGVNNWVFRALRYTVEEIEAARRG